MFWQEFGGFERGDAGSGGGSFEVEVEEELEFAVDPEEFDDEVFVDEVGVGGGEGVQDASGEVWETFVEDAFFYVVGFFFDCAVYVEDVVCDPFFDFGEEV